MTAKLREIKTDRSVQKETMLAHLEKLTAEVNNDQITNLITIIDYDGGVEFEVMGDINDVGAVGMLDVAKLGYSMGLFDCDH